MSYSLAINQIQNVNNIINAATSYDVDTVEGHLHRLAVWLRGLGFAEALKVIKSGLAFSCSYDDFMAALADARFDVETAASLDKVTE